MATIEEYVEPFASILVPVPAIGNGVCQLCHGVPSAGDVECWNCRDFRLQLTHPCAIVLPVSLTCSRSVSSQYDTSEPGRQIHYMLNHYKNDLPGSPRRKRFATNVIAILAHFLVSHGPCIEAHTNSSIDNFVVVPSTRGRVGKHPLVAAASVLPGFAERILECLVVGERPPSHNNAFDDGFSVRGDVRGRSLIIIDDTYTTGARAQSAASALTLAGAQVHAIVPIGRVINPLYADENAAYWERQTRLAFRFDECALCAS